jgi:predicted glycosyltransferase
MTVRLDGARVLIYSHDTFGLGHLRRCRAIAHSLVDQYKGLTVLILSGSPIIGSFDFRARVDFIRVPGVIKLYNGEYTSLGLHIDLEQTLAIRSSIIQHTANIFQPDLFLVDKEPLGLKGEVKSTLQLLRQQGASCVLGLRDVMDEPLLLRREWKRKKVAPALESLYDEIWIYGLKEISDPLSGQDVSSVVSDRVAYTGYLPRSLPHGSDLNVSDPLDGPYVLVTTGGGGDGASMIDWLLRAYEQDSTLPYGAVVVLGPFMPPQQQKEFQDRIDRLDRVAVITFDAHLEVLMQRAVGVVAMGGYNTFCEILSLDKRALLIPRSTPRREQLIRASRAQALGLVRMLDGERYAETDLLISALHDLPGQPLPSEISIPGLLDGLENVNRLAARRIQAPVRAARSFA